MITIPKTKSALSALFAAVLSRLDGYLGSYLRPSFVLSNPAANVNTRCPGNECKAVMIKSLTTNTAPIWIDFGTAAKSGQCCELIPGSNFAGPLDNTSRINALFTVANEKLIIIYRK